MCCENEPVLARLDLQEIPENGAVAEPSPELVPEPAVIPAGALSPGTRIRVTASGSWTEHEAVLITGA